MNIIIIQPSGTQNQNQTQSLDIDKLQKLLLESLYKCMPAEDESIARKHENVDSKKLLQQVQQVHAGCKLAFSILPLQSSRMDHREVLASLEYQCLILSKLLAAHLDHQRLSSHRSKN